MSSPERVTAYEDALRGVAHAVVVARSRTNGMGLLHPEDGAALLVSCESQLAALIALGFVPGEAAPGSRPLTAHPTGRPEL